MFCFLQKFVEQMNCDLKAGIIQPINSTVFNAPDIQEAFRFMASGRHIGRILLKIRENRDEMLPVKTVPKACFDPNECVVLVGGLGGFGMELSGWLVSRGCRKIVLCSRSGVTNGYQAMRIE
jgi:fatty acid synthase, animal type